MVMLKSVLSAIPSYAMSCFKLPTSLCKRIQSALTRFWWDSRDGKKKMDRIAWKKLSWSKKNGGLGFRDIQCFNDAMLAKLSWRLVENPQGLLARILFGKYCPKEAFLKCKQAATSSHGWRSLMVGRDLLKSQLGWEIGNGVAVNIWYEPWLSCSTKLQPIGPATKDTKDLTVADLFHLNTSEWNQEKIEAILPCYTSEIMTIKPSQLGAPDKLVWLGKSTGVYSTKTGYFTALEKQKTEDEHQRINGFNWLEEVWKQKVSPKLKVFLLKIANKALPVGECLALRHISVNPLCKQCGELETLTHMLFQCSFSQKVWREAPFVSPTETGHWDEYELAWDRVKAKICLPPTRVATGPLAPWIFWSLWVSRNKLVFNEKIVTVEETLTSAISLAKEWLAAQQSPSTSNQGTVKHDRRHETEVTICQSDAAWRSETNDAGMGWVFISEENRVLEFGKSTS